MRITGLALVPPPTAADLPKVTPELLASVLARYSRSNEGIHAILSKVDLANPDASIDRILKFVDYGHASIGGLTGGLAVALDDVSMWLAYKIFEIAQMADGQESSTRYITMDAANVPTAEELGIPADLAGRWREVLTRSFAAYHAEYARLDALAVAEPQRVRLPADAKPAADKAAEKTAATPTTEPSENTADKPAGQATEKPAEKAVEKPAAKPAPGTFFIIQVTALSDTDKAQQVKQQIADAGVRSYTEVVAAGKGNVTRVRAGPFTTREEAEQARAKLATVGLEGKVAAL